MAAGDKPHWTLNAMDPDNVCKGKVGVGWNNEDGSINIRLNPFVVLDAMDDLKIRLWPVDQEKYEERQRKRERTSATTPPSDLEDDIPF